MIPMTSTKGLQSARRPYETPVIRTFGSIATLTQGGGGTKTDGGGSKPHK